MSEVYDLIAVGCGAAGLSAALSFVQEASKSGRSVRVSVLEVAPFEERGGATRWTGAGLRLTASDELDPLWLGEMERVSKGLVDLDYCRRLERETPPTMRFVRDAGVEIMRTAFDVAWDYNEPVSHPSAGGYEIVEKLAAALEKTGMGEILYGTEATRLSVADNGSIAGIFVRGADGFIRELKAPVVVLGCGGFEGNPRMLSQYMGANACDLKLLAPGLKYNKGAGLEMAMAIGADTSGQFDMAHTELVDARTNHPDAVIHPHPFGIVVNKHGKRFYDEGQATFELTFELIAYEVWRNQDQQAYFIADQTIANNADVMALAMTDQPPITADTLEDLADQLGLERDSLLETIAAYNASVGEGEFDPYKVDGLSTVGLEPPKSNWAYRLENAPFIAFPMTAAICFTYGGLKTDTDARVLATNGRPIPGLYAAGEITGLFYHEYPSMVAVLRSLTFGRIAGIHAAAQLVS